jgi:hypothetical protein
MIVFNNFLIIMKYNWTHLELNPKPRNLNLFGYSFQDLTFKISIRWRSNVLFKWYAVGGSILIHISNIERGSSLWGICFIYDFLSFSLAIYFFSINFCFCNVHILITIDLIKQNNWLVNLNVNELLAIRQGYSTYFLEITKP